MLDRAQLPTATRTAWTGDEDGFNWKEPGKGRRFFYTNNYALARVGESWVVCWRVTASDLTASALVIERRFENERKRRAVRRRAD